MNKISILAFAISALLFSCQNSSGDKTITSAEQEVSVQTGEIFTVEKGSSTFIWKGYHKGGFDPRFGTLQTEGTLSIADNQISGGSFIIDINSLATDEKSVDPAKTGGKTAADLDVHLKTADFFESDKYPTAKFEITNVAIFNPTKDKSVLEGATNVISGNLTIKDKTVNVSFPVKVTITEGNVNLQSQFTINRQDWGLSYGTEGDPKDWMISQEVDITLDINAKK